MSGNSCHFRGCANPRADWCKRVELEWTVVTLRYIVLRWEDMTTWMLADRRWKSLISSQEGVFGLKAVLFTLCPGRPWSPSLTIRQSCACTLIQTFKLVSCLENCLCLLRGVVISHRSLSPEFGTFLGFTKAKCSFADPLFVNPYVVVCAR